MSFINLTLNFTTKYASQQSQLFVCKVGWSKTPVSSQTDKLMAATKFSDYLGLKHYKKALAYWPQNFVTYRSIQPTGNSGYQLKKHVLGM